MPALRWRRLGGSKRAAGRADGPGGEDILLGAWGPGGGGHPPGGLGPRGGGHPPGGLGYPAGSLCQTGRRTTRKSVKREQSFA